MFSVLQHHVKISILNFSKLWSLFPLNAHLRNWYIHVGIPEMCEEI